MKNFFYVNDNFERVFVNEEDDGTDVITRHAFYFALFCCNFRKIV